MVYEERLSSNSSEILGRLLVIGVLIIVTLNLIIFTLDFRGGP